MMVHTCVTLRRKLYENTITTLLFESRKEKRNEEKVHMGISERKQKIFGSSSK
jgi:hypothetical protein